MKTAKVNTAKAVPMEGTYASASTARANAVSKTKRIATAAASVAALALVLAGCSSATTPMSGPAAEAPKVNITSPATDQIIADASATTVEGLRQQRVSNSIGAVALWDYVPGATTLNEQVATLVLTQLNSFAESHDTVYEPEAQPPLPADAELPARGCRPGDSFKPAAELLADPTYGSGEGTRLLVACDILFATGPTIAQRVRVVTGDATTTGLDEATTLYTDVANNETVTGNQLFNQGSLPELMARAIELAELPEAVDPALTQDFADSVTDLYFDPQGGVTFTVPAKFFDDVLDANWAAMTPEEQEIAGDDAFPAVSDISLSVDPSAVATFMSPLGQQIATSRAQSEPFTVNPVGPGNDYVSCQLSPCVALTFDDGPSDQTTPTLLADLDKYQAAATFFVLGQNAEIFPEIVKQEAAAGHEVGSHSYDHPDLTTVSAETLQEQLGSTATAIEAAIGHGPTTFRPPYGAWNDQVLTVAGVPAILWSIDTNDWQHPGHAELVSEVVDQAVPGDIVLMHDIHPSSVEAVPDILSGLQRRGFTLATISQLFGSDPAAGDIYYRLAQPE